MSILRFYSCAKQPFSCHLFFKNMNAVAALCHFCEAHGPRIVFCCQPYRNESAKFDSHNDSSVFLHENSLNVSRSSTVHDENPNENVRFYGKIDQYLENLVRSEENGNISSMSIFPTLDYDVLKDSCAACLSAKNLKPSFLTNDHDEKVSFVGSQLPYNPEVLSAVRNACVRSLSCEICPEREGPIFFGDETNGYCLCYAFSLKDLKARGFQRWYSLCLLSPDQLLLINFYDLLTRCLRITAHCLKKEAQQIFEREQANGRENIAQIAFSGRLSWMPSGFMKAKVDDVANSAQPARSLAEMTGDEHIFCKIHKLFVWTLKLPLVETISSVLDGVPSQDDIVRAELSNEDSDLAEFSPTNQETAAKSSNNNNNNRRKSDSDQQNRVFQPSCMFANVYSDVNLPYARFLSDDVFKTNDVENGSMSNDNNDEFVHRDSVHFDGGCSSPDSCSSMTGSSFSTIEKNDERTTHDAIENLKVLFEIFGLEAFRILASHVVIGDQIVVRTETPKIAELVINALKTLLPVGCCKTVYYSEVYLAPWSCNFLGLSDSTPVPENWTAVPSTPGCSTTTLSFDRQSIDDSFVVLTAKFRDNKKGAAHTTGSIRLENCNFRLHHVGLPPDEYPSFVDRLLALLTHFINENCQNNTRLGTILDNFSSNLPRNLPLLKIRLTALKEEWLDKAKLFLQFNKQSRTMNFDSDTRWSFFRKIAKLDRKIDETVVKFFQAGLSKQYKSYVTSKIALSQAKTQ